MRIDDKTLEKRRKEGVEIYVKRGKKRGPELRRGRK